MGFFEEAAAELVNNRREDLWIYCLSSVDMDVQKAQALYIKKAAKILHEEAINNEVAYKEEQERKRLKQEYERHQFKVELDQIARSEQELPYIKPKLTAVLVSVVLFVFYIFPLINESDSMFLSVWRWVSGLGFIIASGYTVFASLSYIRRLLLPFEFKRRDADSWLNIAIFGFFSVIYVLLYYYF
jgi:hypothetical protein